MVYKIENIIFILKTADGEQYLCLGKYSIDSDSDFDSYKSKVKEECDYSDFYLLSNISDNKYNLLSHNLKFDLKIEKIEPEKEKTIDEFTKELRKYEPTGYPFKSTDKDIYTDLYMKYIEKLFDNYCKNNNFNGYQFGDFECCWEETYERYHHKQYTISQFYSDDYYIEVRDINIIYDDGEDTQHHLESNTSVKLIDMESDKEITEITDKNLKMFMDYLLNIHSY